MSAATDATAAVRGDARPAPRRSGCSPSSGSSSRSSIVVAVVAAIAAMIA